SGRLRAIAGVADVVVVGGVTRELDVELIPEALESTGVGVLQVVSALQAQNLAAPVGRVVGDVNERAIRLRGRIERPDQFADLIVAAPSSGSGAAAAAGTGTGTGTSAGSGSGSGSGS